MKMQLMIAERVKTLVGHNLFGPGIFSLVIKIAGAGLSYVMFVAFAHLLSAEQYGIFAFSFNLAIVIAAFIGFGYSTAILRYWPKYLAQGNPDYAKGAVVMGGLLSAIGIAIALIIGFGVDRVLALIHSPLAARSFFSVALLAIATCLADYLAGILRAQNSVVGAMLTRDVIWRVLAPSLAFIIAATGIVLNSANAVFLCATALLILLIPQTWLISRSIARTVGNIKPKLDWNGTRASLLPLWGAGIVFAMIQQMDVVIVGYLMSGTDTGAYFAAQKTATLLSLVLIAGGIATAPTMAALYEKKDVAELQKLCRQLVMAIAFVTLVGFLILILAGPLLLGLFNRSFTSAYAILIILAFGCMIDALAGPTAYLMQMTSYEKSYLKIMVVCYALVIILQFILIPQFGGLGAAIASASGTIIWNLWAIFLLRNRAGLDPSIFGLIFPLKTKSAN